MRQGQFKNAAASLICIAGLVGTAQAETDYRDFYAMDEDAQGAIISKTAQTLIEDGTANDDKIRTLCMIALFFSSEFNPIQGRQPEGWKTLFDVIAYERRSMMSFQHSQSVEDTLRMIAELYCPIGMK